MNKNVLAARLERLREYIDNLEAVQRYDCKRFTEDPFIHGMAERNLHLAIECLMDIGNHIIAQSGYKKPESYADIFRILQENNIISADLLKRIEGMAAFRNILVHDYMRLDRQKVYETIQNKTAYLAEMGEIFANLL